MTRSVFEKQLAEVQEDMLVMAGMVQDAILHSVEALKTRNVELARRVIAASRKDPTGSTRYTFDYGADFAPIAVPD